MTIGDSCNIYGKVSGGDVVLVTIVFNIEGETASGGHISGVAADYLDINREYIDDGVLHVELSIYPEYRDVPFSTSGRITGRVDGNPYSVDFNLRVLQAGNFTVVLSDGSEVPVQTRTAPLGVNTDVSFYYQASAVEVKIIAPGDLSFSQITVEGEAAGTPSYNGNVATIPSTTAMTDISWDVSYILSDSTQATLHIVVGN